MQPSHSESPLPPIADAPPAAGRVLVVDDERTIRELFRRILLFDGFDVVVASGGAEGLRILGSDPSIALVLLDLDMPGIDGRRFRFAQCSDPRLAEVPTVVVTGTMLTDDVRAEMRANDYLGKPVNHAEFMRVVERYCARIGDGPLAAGQRRDDR